MALWKVVESAVLFQKTVAPEAKPVPLAVRVNAPLPAAFVLGLSEPSAGPATTEMVAAFEVSPAELTVT